MCTVCVRYVCGMCSVRVLAVHPVMVVINLLYYVGMQAIFTDDSDSYHNTSCMYVSLNTGLNPLMLSVTPGVPLQYLVEYPLEYPWSTLA